MEATTILTRGALAQAIYARIAAGKEEGISGLFSADALADYAQRTSAAVETTQVQALAAKLVAANLIARHGHGVYAVADPFVRKVWGNCRTRAFGPAE